MLGTFNTLATPIFDAYWSFAAERQRIFFRRITNRPEPWTDDPILQKYKFTNAYRASDRVSQYLIRHVIYSGSPIPADTIFRILLFKFFNRISTWEYLEKNLGEIRCATFSLERYNRLLTAEHERGGKLYSPAYIMPPCSTTTKYKHTGHLALLRRMMQDGIAQQIRQAVSLAAVFDIFRAYKSVGDFLAYQWTIDVNYSPVINFSEMDFVVAGPGAKRGLRKCFSSSGGFSDAELIRMVAENQVEEFKKRQINFPTLWGRPLQLIDCQNLFCELDKYTRVAPNAQSVMTQRPKQRFHPSDSRLAYWYPPKWGLNEKISATEK